MFIKIFLGYLGWYLGFNRSSSEKKQESSSLDTELLDSS